MAKSKKNKHKANRKRTQKYTGPIPVQFAKHLKDIIRTKSTGMEEYNYLIEEKYKTNTTTTYIKTRKNNPLCEVYKDDGDCFLIAGQVLSLTWYKYSKTIYKMSQSILDYIDNTFRIPDYYDDILNNLPQKIIYVDLSNTDIMTYDGDKIYGFFINVSSVPYQEYVDTSTGEHFKFEDNESKSLEFTGILSAVSDHLPTITIVAPINEIINKREIPYDFVGAQYNIWIRELMLKIALYLCISKPNNIETKKIDSTKNGTHQSADVTIVDLSDQYKEGLVFDPHKNEKTVYEKDGESENTDNHMPPHIRSGHWQTYWTGKGRTVPVQKFVKECFVNCEDASKLPTVGRKIKEDKS